MTAPIVELRDVAVAFVEGQYVLNHVSIDMAAGEFLTLIGPSGCGKSTILNLVAGLRRPTSGDVLFLGEPVRSVNTNVGYMTQDDTLLPWRTVEDNVRLPLRLRRLPNDEVRARTMRGLERMELAEAAKKYPAQLSGGMKRRALLARSMVYDPALLLMDEPFGALDAQLREQLQIELRRAVTESGQSVLFITHDISEAVLLSDRVIVLGGRPAAPIATFGIPFGRSRDLASLRYLSEFVEIERAVHEALSTSRSLSPNGRTEVNA